MRLGNTIYNRTTVYQHATLGAVQVNYCYQDTGMLLVTPVGKSTGRYVYPGDLK